MALASPRRESALTSQPLQLQFVLLVSIRRPLPHHLALLVRDVQSDIRPVPREVSLAGLPESPAKLPRGIIRSVAIALYQRIRFFGDVKAGTGPTLECP